jgi:hypothetical protein
MYEQIEKPKEKKSIAVANSVAQKKSNVKQGFGFLDNRPKMTQLKSVQKMTNINPQVMQLAESKKSSDKAMAKSMANVKAYSSLGDAYDDEQLATALAKTGGVKGHHSGGAGDGMNAATKMGLGSLGDQLKKDKASSKASKKKPVIKGAAQMSDFEKALVQAQTTYKDNLGDFVEYVYGKGWEFSDEEDSQLYAAVDS